MRTSKGTYECPTCKKEFAHPRALGDHYKASPKCVTEKMAAKIRYTDAYRQRQKKMKSGAKIAGKGVVAHENPYTKKKHTGAVSVPSGVNFCPRCGLSLERLSAIADLL